VSSIIGQETVRHKILKIGDESTIKVPEFMTNRPQGRLKYKSVKQIVLWINSKVMVYVIKWCTVVKHYI